MEGSSRFDPSLADRVLSRLLLASLRHVFAQGISDCLLVGGTALAGFYAAHRRSDDLDLFTGNAISFRQTVLAVRSLRSIGVEFDERSGSNQYYRAVCGLEDLSFTVDVVLDERLLDIAETNAAGDVVVAGLPTLFAMKAASLVSRCSEKDLYDLLWLFKAYPDKELSDLIDLGRTVDAGMNGEALVYSMGSVELERQACEFAVEFGVSAATVFAKITAFRRDLLRAVDLHLSSGLNSTLRDVVRRIRKL